MDGYNKYDPDSIPPYLVIAGLHVVSWPFYCVLWIPVSCLLKDNKYKLCWTLNLGFKWFMNPLELCGEDVTDAPGQRPDNCLKKGFWFI